MSDHGGTRTASAEGLDRPALPGVDPAHIARVMAAELRGAARAPEGRLAELRRWRDRLDTVLQVVGEGVVVVDFAEQVVYANDAAARLLGYASTGALVGRHASTVLEGFDVVDQTRPVPQGRAIGLEALHGDTACDVKLHLANRSTREERCLFVRSAPLADDRGRVIAVVVVLRDCTREVRYEAERDRLLAEAREADRRKDEFLAMLAHELRNPLATVHYALELIRVHASDPAYVEEKRAIAEGEVRLLSRLVEDLLDVSRVTRGAIELRREHLDLGALVARDTRTQILPLDDGRHRVSIETPSSGPFIDADPVRVTQVLGNLVRNAAKFTPPGGHIEVRVALEGSAAVLCVRDEGVGIDRELLPHVFEPFVQGPQSLDRSRGGLGIGLAVVRRVVELHGGSVEARSDGPGRGCEVVVRFPAVDPPPRPEPRDAPAPRLDARDAGARRRVLVVDDNVAGARVLALLIADWSCEVRTANDGVTALATAAQFRPDVVLLDIGLPGMHGFEVARRLRAEHDLAGTRIVAISGYGDAAARRRSGEAGIDAHLVKPVDEADLRAAVFAPSLPTPAPDRSASIDDA